MTDLRPCPFCGGEVSITYISADNVFSIWHKYDGCKFIEPMYIDGKDAKSLSDARNIWNERSVPYLMKEQEAVVHCGDCENFCFDNISPNAGRCMLTNKSHSKTWFCAHGKREEGR